LKILRRRRKKIPVSATRENGAPGGALVDIQQMDLGDLMARGQMQTGDLTFYKLAFAAFERLTWQNSATYDDYRRSLLTMVSGFLASVKPQYLPQAIAAKNLLLKKIRF
jgi:hypothetical protein